MGDIQSFPDTKILIASPKHFFFQVVPMNNKFIVFPIKFLSYLQSSLDKTVQYEMLRHLPVCSV